MESEDEVAEEEHCQRHASKNDDSVAPSHVAVNCTAGFSRIDAGASWQIGITAPFGLTGGAVGDARCNSNTDWLPHGKKGDKETSIMR